MVWPVIHPTGTIYYDPEKAFNGYTVWAPLASRNVSRPGEDPSIINVMDMAGNIVHSWRTVYPVHYGRLLPNGNMLALLRRVSEGSPLTAGYPMGGAGGLIVEYDWDGSMCVQLRQMRQ